MWCGDECLKTTEEALVQYRMHKLAQHRLALHLRRHLHHSIHNVKFTGQNNMQPAEKTMWRVHMVDVVGISAMRAIDASHRRKR